MPHIFRRHTETILVVEDDDGTRDMYRRALVAAGYQVRGVADGLDALQTIEAEPPAAVILDLMLPRLSGIDVYKELRAHERTRGIPLVIVTGSDIREPEGSSTRFFLRKPVSPDTLVLAVDAVLRIPRGIGI